MGLIDLTTVPEVKRYLGLRDTNADDRIGKAIALVSAHLEQLLDRYLKEEAQTEFFDIHPGQRAVFLRGIPVVSVDEVANDTSRNFDSLSVIDADNYAVDKAVGAVMFSHVSLSRGPQVLRVKYTGGMAPDTGTFKARFPDVAGLVELQVIRVVSHYFKGGSRDFDLEAGQANFWGSGLRRALLIHRRRQAG